MLGPLLECTALSVVVRALAATAAWVGAQEEEEAPVVRSAELEARKALVEGAKATVLAAVTARVGQAGATAPVVGVDLAGHMA